MQRQVVMDGFVIGLALESWPSENGFDFRPKQKHIAMPSIEQGFLADTVSCKDEFFGALIPQRDGKHAPQTLKYLFPPAVIPIEDDFGVGVAFKVIAKLVEIGT